MNANQQPAVLPEKVKGHDHYLAILCTGKQKAISVLEAYLDELVAKGDCTVLSRAQEHRSKLLRQYEQVKILLATKLDRFELDPDITDHLDFSKLTNKTSITLTASTPKQVDEWLKWNVKEATAQFQLRGGQLDIREEKEAQANGAIWRTCHYTLRGELLYAIKARDVLLEKTLLEPESLDYVI